MSPVCLLPLATFSSMILGWLMAFLSLFLILLILIQRGKGGGLSGALGGPGGQSAFGSKAGDTFTLITVVLAGIWIFVCAFTMWLLGTHTAPVIAETPSSMSAGPGDGAEDIAAGLVVETNQDDEGDGSLVPKEVESTESSEGDVDAAEETTEEPAEDMKADDTPTAAEPAEAAEPDDDKASGDKE